MLPVLSTNLLERSIMSAINLLWATGIAFAFVAWQILGKWSGASPAWIGVIVLGGSFLVNAALGAKQLTDGPMFAFKAFVWLALAAAINGAAIHFLNLKLTDPSVKVGMFVTTMTIMMAAFSPLLDYLLNGATISVRQAGGIALAILAIYLLQG